MGQCWSKCVEGTKKGVGAHYETAALSHAFGSKKVGLEGRAFLYMSVCVCVWV